MFKISGLPHFLYKRHIGELRALSDISIAIFALTLPVICLAQKATSVPTDPPHTPSSLERQAASIARMQKALDRPAAASLAAQRQSISRQADNREIFIEPLPPSTLATMEPRIEPACDPLPESEIDSILKTESSSTGIEFDLLKAIVGQESAFRPCAESPRGAIGLMQLMPETAIELGATNPWDPQENIRLGAKYFKDMLTRYDGDQARALAAYNAGPAQIDAAGGIPDIPETQDYVRRILKAAGKTQDEPKTPAGQR
jgi:soluble lytic murein transglycosylase-like protein